MNRNRIIIFGSIGFVVLLLLVAVVYLLNPSIPKINYSKVIINDIQPNNVVMRDTEIVFTAEGSINTTENESIKTVAKFPPQTSANVSLHAAYYFLFQGSIYNLYKLNTPQQLTQVNTTYFQWTSDDSFFYTKQPPLAQGTDVVIPGVPAEIKNLSNNSSVTIPKANIYAKFFDFTNNILLFAQYNGIEQNSPIIKQNITSNASETLFSPYSIDQFPKNTKYIYQIKDTAQSINKYYQVKNNNLEELTNKIDWQLTDFLNDNDVISLVTEEGKKFLVLFDLNTNKQTKLAELSETNITYSKLLYAKGNIYLVGGTNFYTYSVGDLLK